MNDNETPVVEPRPATAEEAKAVENAKQGPAKPGPAHEIRQAQALLAGGLFPGQMAPAIVAAFSKLESIAARIELDYKHEQEFKERQKA